MAGSKILKNRIRATKNIKQITHAMEAVSAVKMRRSQHLAITARPYALAALEILKGLRGATGKELAELSPLLAERPVKKTCVAVITSDKGLAGSFNTSVIKATEKLLESIKNPVTMVAIGKKGRDHFLRKQTSIVKEFVGTGDFGTIEETLDISNFLANLFLQKEVDEVVLVYTDFISALKQEVIARKVIPFTQKSLEEIIDGILPRQGQYANMPRVLGVIKTPTTHNFLFEPSPERILQGLLPELLSIQIFYAILEANASEHSSRMIAMKNASENASDLIGELTIEFNKARQASITKELAEITAGKEALNV